MKLVVRILFLTLALFTITHFGVMAQDKTLKEADTFFYNFEYALALPVYKKVLGNQEPTLYLSQRIADCYRLMNNFKEAEYWYQQVISFPDYDPIALKFAAEAARKNGRYVIASQLYEQYGQRVPEQAAVANQLAADCNTALQWVAKPQPFEVQKQEKINSANSDFSPVVYQGGLIFTSDRVVGKENTKNRAGWTGKPFSKIYYSPKAGGLLSTPTTLPKQINNQYHNGSVTFTPDGNTMYFTRINFIKSKQKKVNTDPFSWVKFNGSANYINRLEIYTSQKKGENWDAPQPFAYNKASLYSVGHPALSPDGQALYFVSDMPGGHGETDIYYCTRVGNGPWSQPVNAGNQINTAGKEMFPVVNAQGVLYFSSEGHQGMGGLDIFSAEGAGNTWKNVQNLKYPLNSPADDFGITFDEVEGSGFLSSNRDSEDGTDDIYNFKKGIVQCDLAGKTIERILNNKGVFTEKPIEHVLVRLYREGDSTAMNTYTDAQGNFTFPVKDQQKYTIVATKTGYLTKSDDITPTCQTVMDLIKIGMGLNPNTLNKPFILENIYYDFDKYDIRADAAPELDKLVRTLKDNPTIRIELGSHTDSRQTVAYNQRLSQLRAEAAVKYVVLRGIDAKRVTAKGYGETKPLNRCRDGVPCSELEHQLNRRTEVKILSR